ncbi:Cytochrome P450 3A17 [Fragariocoptes setiger]|uniref:Cytochrome P450 3A17 n=1 Tax=Fragariocoptes setiger TaxID=1670756 RepID=A0ABQ7SAZ6_9ACAR|nr:Cytochrome P450 3A17 [Fragariocoptes setiger]
MIQSYILIGVVWLVYWLYKRYCFSVHYLKESNIPQPQVADFFRGNGNLINDTGLRKQFKQLHETLGDTLGLTSGPNVLLFTTDAELLYRVYKEQASSHVNRGDAFMPSDLINDHSLLGNEDADWQRVRNIIGPELTLNKLNREGIQKDLNDTTERVRNYIQDRVKQDSAVVDAGQLFKKFTLDVTLRTLYDQHDLVDYEGVNNYMLDTLEMLVKSIYHPAFIWFQYIPMLRQIVLMIDRVTTNFRGAVIQASNKALENPDVRSNCPRLKHKLLSAFKEGRMSKVELWGNSAFMVAAGWETTAQSLQAFMWLMATHTEKQSKLRDDIVRDGHKSQYLDWCIRETLRLYPPTFTARRLGHDLEWKGMTLRKGMMVVPNMFILHKKPEYWGDDVETFRPERFAPEEASKHHKAQFFIFGMGPRNCVGEKLAMLEMQMLVARLITEYSIQTCDQTPKILDVYNPVIFTPIIWHLELDNSTARFNVAIGRITTIKARTMIQQSVLVGLITFFVYWLYKRYYFSLHYLKANNIPQPPASDFFRGNGDLINNYAMKGSLSRLHGTFGQTFGLTTGPTVFVMTTDADLLYKVYKEEASQHVNRGDTFMPSDVLNTNSLVGNEGTDWQRCRNIIGPELTLNKLNREGIQKDLNDAAECVCNFVHKRLEQDSSVIDAGKLFKKFTLDSVLRANFDHGNLVNYEGSENNLILDTLEMLVKNIYHPGLIWFQYLPILSPIVMWLDRITTNFRAAIIQLSNKALENPAFNQSKALRLKHKLWAAFKANHLSQLELWGNTAFMVAAGWDTTAQALQAIMWLMATNPEKQAKLRDDIVRDGHRSKYLDWCIRETLRLYPPALTGRCVGHDFEWKGMTLRTGMRVSPSMFDLHKKPEYWGDDADVFRPERFAPEEASKHHKAQYFAFGMGPRNCVGAKLAMLEMQMLVSRLLMEYSVQLCDESPKALEIINPVIFAPMIRDCVILRFRYYFSVHYLKANNIPQPHAVDFFRGNGNLINDHNLKNKLIYLHGKLGDTFGLTSGPTVFLFTTDADLLYRVFKEQANSHLNHGDSSMPSDLMNDHSLLGNEDADWQRVRNIIGSELTLNKLNRDGLQKDLNDAAECVCNYLKRRAKPEVVVDAGKLFKKFTLDTVLRTLFDQHDLVDYEGDKNYMLDTLEMLVKSIYHPALVWFQYIPMLRPIVLMIDRVATNFRGALIEASNKVLENYTSNGPPRLKHKLLDAFKEGRLSQLELWGNAAFMVAAGWDTTAQTLAALVWLLAAHPEKQTKLRDDIVRDGHQSHYLDWCIRETLRLYPPALTSRQLAHDIEWKGMTLREAMRITADVFVLHKRPEYWGNDADVFRPERFEPEEASKHHKAQFFAFGMGPRNCVGEKLAMLEMQMLVARLITEYSIQTCDQTPKILDVYNPIIFAPMICNRFVHCRQQQINNSAEDALTDQKKKCCSPDTYLFTLYLNYFCLSNLPPIIDFFRGNGHQVNDHGLKKLITEQHELLGESFGITSGATSYLITIDADLLYKVFKEQAGTHMNRGNTLLPSDIIDNYSLLASEGNVWLRYRNIIGPELTLNKLKRDDMQRDLNIAVERVCNFVEQRAKPETVIDVGLLFKKFTLDVVLRIGFDQQDPINFEGGDNFVLDKLDRMFKCIFHPAFIWFQYIPILRPIILLIDRVTTNFRRDIIRISDRALENPEVGPDGPRLKHRLLDAHREGRLSQIEIWGNTAFMVAGGWDTTAQSLAALMWHLAADPARQTKLRDDIIRDGPKSTYLDWCIRETLRLYPPVMTARRLEHDIEWKGMTLRKGLMIVPSLFDLHKRPEYWGNDVDDFRPERFAPEESKTHHKAQFFAFGMGPRNCVGGKLAMLEMQMLVTRLITEYRIQLCDQSPKFLEVYNPVIFIPLIRDQVTLKDHNIPQPPIVGFLRGNGHVVNDHAFKKYISLYHKQLGESFGMTSGATSYFITIDPDLLYKVFKEQAGTHMNRGNTLLPSDIVEHYSLLASEGNTWLRYRNIIGPELTLNKLKRDDMQRDLSIAVESVCNYFEQRVKRDAVIEVGLLFKKFTLDVVLRIAFDQRNPVEYEGGDNFVLDKLDRLFKCIFHPAFIWFQYIPILRPIILLIDRVTTNFRRDIIRISDRALENPEVGPDGPRLKHRLLDAHREGRLSQIEIWGNTAFMVAGGWDTTAQSLAALMWHLAADPARQTKLRDDIIRDGPKSTYLDWCIRETLRLYPPVMTARRLEHDIEWKGMTLRKGLMIVPSLFDLHKRPEYWGNDVDDFRPERFAPEESKTHHKAQFFAFGMGPRNCVGGKLAMLEMQMLVTRLITEYRIQLCDQSPKFLEVYNPVIFIPMIRGHVTLKFVKI